MQGLGSRNRLSRSDLMLFCMGVKLLSLTLREEHRLRLFENRVLRRIFGPKRDEVTGGWRKLPNEELHNLCIITITHN
jgi:hypothetical protein